MARFRAFSDSDTSSSSDSSSDTDDQQLPTARRHVAEKISVEEEEQDLDDEEEEEEERSGEEEDEEEDSDSGASSEMHEDELYEPKKSIETHAPRARIGGVDSQRMHVMQTSLFRMPEEAAALKAMNHIADASLRRPAQTLRKHGRESDGDMRSWDTRPSFAKDIQPTLTRPTRKYTRVEGAMSVANGAEDALGDAGLSFGRSFRVGWGPGGILVHPSSGTTL